MQSHFPIWRHSGRFSRDRRIASTADEQAEVELLKKAVRMMAYAMAELAQAEEVNEWM
mgnify:CR=1 FL=1